MSRLGVDAYREYFFEQAPFNDVALDSDTYLIIGRRGSGKTSLAQYLTFQSKVPAVTIDVDEPEAYGNILAQCAAYAVGDTDDQITHAVQLWQYVIWSMVFRRLDIDCGAAIKVAHNRWGRFIAELLGGLVSKFVGGNPDRLLSSLQECLSGEAFKRAQQQVRELAEETPVVIAVDTLERYSTSNEPLMVATAGLIEAAAGFNQNVGRDRVNVKLFMSGEVFPHLRDRYVRNTLKHIVRPLVLHWRPRDVLRLVCWRLYKFLMQVGESKTVRGMESVDWNDFREVRARVWDRFFGAELVNANGLRESSLPYVMRHTQMRPRQLVVMCNAIANLARQRDCFPEFKADSILVEAVAATESDLASEVLNSYATIYQGVGDIVGSLNQLPMVFRGRELDRVAHRTKRYWAGGEYSQTAFRQLVTELGIVGVVRHVSGDGVFVQADFEYFTRDRLIVEDDVECVIHPMFYARLNTRLDRRIIYPFPDSPDYRELQRR